MNIEIDDKSGFCFGVVRAITEAEKALAGGGRVYSLGDIVHNRIEVQRLEQLGLRTVTHEEMPRLEGKRLFIRAHGEPPTTYREAQRLGIELIDATCPVVARLQERVVRAHEKMRPVGGQVVILGKRGHAEVVGLTGQVEEPTTVIEREEDLDQLDFTRPIIFLSQTTQSIALFEHLAAEMRRRAADPGRVEVIDTICRQVSNREQHLEAFARRFDVVLFVCGRKSSNGKVLYEVCRSANPRTHTIEEASEIRPEWLAGAASVGICGATSTPPLAHAAGGRGRRSARRRTREGRRTRTRKGRLSGCGARRLRGGIAAGRRNIRSGSPEQDKAGPEQTDKAETGQDKPARPAEPEKHLKKQPKNNHTMKRYLIRAVKYFVALCVLCAAIMLLNQLYGATLSFSQTLYVMFHTPRGLLLPAVILVLAFFYYPRFGFIVRDVEGDLEENRQQIVNALHSSGFKLVDEQEGVMMFRASTLWRRLLMLGEDEIRVSQYGQWVRLEGIRRGVARAAYRLDSYIEQSKYE